MEKDDDIEVLGESGRVDSGPSLVGYLQERIMLFCTLSLSARFAAIKLKVLNTVEGRPMYVL